MIILALSIAGGFGAMSRYLLDTWLNRLVSKSGLFVINISGSFLLGLLTGWASVHSEYASIALILGMSFLGGYTTFSAALVESARFAKDGHLLLSLAHAIGMVIPAIAAAALGLWLTA